MTKLEEEIFSKLKRSRFTASLKGSTQGNITIEQAKAAAEVAKKYIEKALDANPLIEVNNLCGMVTDEEIKSKWLKENGITE